MSKPRGPVPSAAAKGNNLRGRAAGPAPSSSSSVASSASSAASAGAAARRPAVRDGASDGVQQQGLKIVNGDQELSILDNKVTIGRRKECDICLSGHSTMRKQQEGRDCSYPVASARCIERHAVGINASASMQWQARVRIWVSAGPGTSDKRLRWSGR